MNGHLRKKVKNLSVVLVAKVTSGIKMNRYDIKRILEKEIERHTGEIAKHKLVAVLRKSKAQRDKATKHFHKKFQTILIAKQMGFEVCECCGNLK